MPFTAGLQVGPYRIMEQLGQGGMATVFKAYHASLDRYVAIKVLHQAFMEDPNFLARFQREARLVAKLEHPNIVPIYDYAEYEGQPYLVMKFIDGETLKARLQSGPLSPAEVSHIVETVGAALGYAHKQGILHRDVKPSNVILATDGQIYLADFGLARIAQSGESTLTTDMVLGTPQYISPEQAMAKKDLDEGTDIYSFGVMIYEMTVGRVPFSGDTPFSVIHDHIYAPLPLPSAVNPKIPPALERFLLKALAKERADRFKDVPEMVRAFQEAWTGSGSSVMRGAATVPAMSPPVIQRAPASSAAPVSVSAQATFGSTTPIPATASQTYTRTRTARWRAPWLWGLGAVGLCLCCGLIFMVYQLRSNGLAAPATETEVPPTALVIPTDTSTPPTSMPTPVQNTQPPPPPVNGPIIDPGQLSVDLTKHLADQNPADPRAHLQYGYALIKAGRQKDGCDQVRQGAALAKGDTAFLDSAAKLFEGEHLWLATAILYLQEAQSSGPISNALANNLHQSVYHGFAEPRAPEMLDYGTIGNVDPSLALIAQAHFSMSNTKDFALAQTLINQLNALKPGLSDTKLLRAELLIKKGDVYDGQVALQKLIDTLGTPTWIMNYATELLHNPK